MTHEQVAVGVALGVVLVGLGAALIRLVTRP